MVKEGQQKYGKGLAGFASLSADGKPIKIHQPTIRTRRGMSVRALL